MTPATIPAPDLWDALPDWRLDDLATRWYTQYAALGFEIWWIVQADGSGGVYIGEPPPGIRDLLDREGVPEPQVAFPRTPVVWRAIEATLARNGRGLDARLTAKIAKV